MEDYFSCIIAEDHPVSRNTLLAYSTKLGLQVLDTVLSGTRLMESAIKHRPDLIITDIGLDRMDGITACKNLLKQGFTSQIIITSVSTDPSHYIAGYELESIDYINKPISFERFEVAIHKAKRRISEQRLLLSLKLNEIRLINIKHKYRDLDIDENQIVCVEKLEKRSFSIYMNDGAVIETSTNLEQIKEQCSENIFIPHRSFLTNIKHISSVVPDLTIPGNYEIIYPSMNKKIPLTRRNYSEYISLKNSQK